MAGDLDLTQDTRPKHAGGRPPKFDYDSPEFLKEIRNLGALGFTDQNVADYYGVDVKTISRNKERYEEFCLALKQGREMAVSSVTRSLFKSATEGNVTAQIFFLKNRAPDRFQDFVDQRISGQLGVKHNGIDLKKLASDPAAAELACEILDRLGSPTGKNDAGGVRLGDE